MCEIFKGGAKITNKNKGTTLNLQQEKMNRPAVLLAEDVLDRLCQGEGLAGAVGPDDEDGGQGDGDGRGYSQDGLFLLGIQTGIQLLIPLPEVGEEMLNQLLFNLLMTFFGRWEVSEQLLK